MTDLQQMETVQGDLQSIEWLKTYFNSQWNLEWKDLKSEEFKNNFDKMCDK